MWLFRSARGADAIKALADLPNRETLLAQLAGGMSSPLSTMAGLLAAQRRGLQAAADHPAVLLLAEQPRRLQHPEVLGDRRQRHLVGRRQVADAGLSQRQARQDRPPGRIAQGGKHGAPARD